MVDILLDAPGLGHIADDALSDHRSLVVPELFDLEVVHALTRWMRRADAKADVLNERFESYRNFPIDRFDHDQLIDRVWELRHSFSAYDAAYVALAEALDVPLLTTDSRLARACHGIVDVVPLPVTSH